MQEQYHSGQDWLEQEKTGQEKADQENLEWVGS